MNNMLYWFIEGLALNLEFFASLFWKFVVMPTGSFRVISSACATSSLSRISIPCSVRHRYFYWWSHRLTGQNIFTSSFWLSTSGATCREWYWSSGWFKLCLAREGNVATSEYLQRQWQIDYSSTKGTHSISYITNWPFVLLLCNWAVLLCIFVWPFELVQCGPLPFWTLNSPWTLHCLYMGGADSGYSIFKRGVLSLNGELSDCLT